MLCVLLLLGSSIDRTAHHSCLWCEDHWRPFRHSAPLFPETQGTCTCVKYQSNSSQVESVSCNDFIYAYVCRSWRERERAKKTKERPRESELADVNLQLSQWVCVYVWVCLYPSKQSSKGLMSATFTCIFSSASCLWFHILNSRKFPQKHLIFHPDFVQNEDKQWQIWHFQFRQSNQDKSTTWGSSFP